MQKTILVAASLLMSVAGLAWGLMYAFGGELLSGAIPVSYSVLSFINLSVLAKTHRIEVFRPLQILMTLLLPFLLMLSLGGFVYGSAAVLWAFIAPLGVLLCWDSRRAVHWFLAYLALIVLSGLANPIVSDANNLPNSLNTVLFVFNIAAVSSVAFVLLLYFVRQKDLAMQLTREKRDLERANLEQELMLRRSEKLATLGRLSAGVAHELNNPAAAVQRSAGQLDDVIGALEESRFRLGQLRQAESDHETLGAMLAQPLDDLAPPDSLDAIDRSDREADIEECLETAGVRRPWEYSSTLVDMGFDTATVTQLAEKLDGPTFGTAIAALHSSAATHNLLNEITVSAGRIGEIVHALKTYTYMDQAPIQFIDINDGLDSTLVMLRAKLSKAVRVTRDYAPDLPAVQGNGGELNQVWTNLVDNAIDAMDGDGELTLRTRLDGECVVVEVTDSGPGIASDVVSQVFDPFFTTKRIGQGTGLGLNISRNIVEQNHHGSLRVDSAPGHTSFIVKLPVCMDVEPDA